MIINLKTDRLRTCKRSWGQTYNWEKPSSNPLSYKLFSLSLRAIFPVKKNRCSKKTRYFTLAVYRPPKSTERVNMYKFVSFVMRDVNPNLQKTCKSYFTAEKISSHLLSSLPTNQISWINKMAACVYTSAWYVYSLVSYLYVMPCIS